MDLQHSQNIHEAIIGVLRQIAIEGDKEFRMDDGDQTVLLASGLDSIDFAIAIARLEDELSVDPFARLETAVYPRTLGELIGVYQEHFRKWPGENPK